jgi:MbtH protein
VVLTCEIVTKRLIILNYKKSPWRDVRQLWLADEITFSVQPLCSPCLCGCCIEHSYNLRESSNLKPSKGKRTAMTRDENEDTTTYKVVLNHEEQYSIWPADRENALGWRDAGKTGPKAECLAYIKEVWTDMRPLSLRKKMKEMALN